MSQLDFEQALNRTLEDRNKIQDRINSGTRTQSDLIKGLNGDMNTQLDTLTKLGTGQDALNDSMNEGIGIGGAFSGMLSSMGGVWDMLVKAISAAKEAVMGFWTLSKSAFHYLSGSWFLNPLIESASDYQSKMSGANDTTQKFIDTFGSLKGDTSAMVGRYMQNLQMGAKGLAGSMKTLYSQIGPGMSAMREHAIETFGALGTEIGLLGPKLEKSGQEWMVLQKGLGLSTEAFAHIARGSSDVKGEIGEMTKAAVAFAERYKVSVKAIGKNLDEALKDHKNFGHLAPQELVKVAGYVTKLGLSMGELTGFADGFDTFESAAEKIGKLSSAFGIQLDTMEMTMADPAEKLELFREAAERAGISMKDLSKNRHEMNYLSEALNIPIDKLKQMGEISTSEFGFTNMADEVGEDMKKMTQEEAFESLSKSMRDIAGSMQQMAQSMSFFQSFTNGVSKGIEKSAAWKKAMKSVLGPMKEFESVGQSVGNMIMELFYKPGKGGENVATGPLAELFDIFFGKGGYFDSMKDFAKTLKGPFQIVVDFFQQMTEKGPEFGKGVNIFDLFFNNLGKIPDQPNEILIKHRKKIYKIVTAIARVIGQAFEFIGMAAVDWVDSIINPEPVTQKFTEEGPTLMETLVESFGTIFEGFISMFSDIWLAGGKLWDHLWNGSDRPGIKETFWEASENGVKNMMNDPKNKSMGDKIFKIFMGWFMPEDQTAKYDKMSLTIGQKMKIFAMTSIKAMLEGVTEIAKSKGAWARQQADAIRDAAGGTSAYDAGGMMVAANPLYQLYNSIAIAGEFSGQPLIDFIDNEIAKTERIGKVRNQKLKAGMTKNQADYYAMLSGIEKEVKDSDGTISFENRGLLDKSAADWSDEDFSAMMDQITSQGAKKWPKLYKHAKKVREVERLKANYDPEHHSELYLQHANEMIAENKTAMLDMFGTMETEAAAASKKASDAALTAFQNQKTAEKLVATGENMNESVAKGLNKSSGKLSAASKSSQQAAYASTMKYLLAESPSKRYIAVGEDMMMGMIIGMFGSFPGESTTSYGLSQAFHDQWDQSMDKIKGIIAGTQAELAHLPIIDIEQKLKRVGSVLKGDSPMSIVVMNDKVEIYLSVKVQLDTKQIAKSLMQPTDSTNEPYFVINPDRKADGGLKSGYKTSEWGPYDSIDSFSKGADF